MGKMKLGTKLLAGGFIVMAIPLLIIGAVSVYKSTEAIHDLAIQIINNLSLSVAHTIDVAMEDEFKLIEFLALSNEVVTAAGVQEKGGLNDRRNVFAAVQKKLGTMRNVSGDKYETIYLAGKDGVIFADGTSGEHIGINLAHREYVQQALRGTPSIGTILRSQKTQNPICMAAYPIRSSEKNEVIGLVATAINVKYLMDKVDEIKIGKTGYSFLIDKTGLFITHPEKDKILKDNLFDFKDESLKKYAHNVLRGEFFTGTYTYEGLLKAAAVAPIDITGWGVFTQIPVQELYAPAYFTRNLIVAVGIIALLLASIFFYFFARSFTRPLSQVVSTAESIALGDLTTHIPVTGREDEIGALIKAFSHMVRYLKEKVELSQQIADGNLNVAVNVRSEKDLMGNALKDMVESLREQIEGIMKGIQILASTSSQISASATQLASSASQTASAVNETTTTVEEVKQTTQVANEKARYVSETAQKTMQVSQAGEDAVRKTISSIQQIKNQMGSIADSIAHLNEQSKAIADIIATIDDLSEQSNLLAVNASIEAAKAGEQGRGFSVVAQEIKNLAEQSKQGTQQVRAILNDIQKATGTAVLATEQGTRIVESGVDQSSKTGEAIQTLAKSIAEAAQSAIQIAASSQQQFAGIEQVTFAVQNINEASSQNLQNMRDMENAARKLQELGQGLRLLVERYNV